MIKKRELELSCPHGDIYPYSKTHLAYTTSNKKYAKLGFKKVQQGDDETTQIAEWNKLRYIAGYLGNDDLKEVIEYQILVIARMSGSQQPK